ncbi:MAG: BrnT family toxin [Chloroflexota bacterium]
MNPFTRSGCISVDTRLQKQILTSVGQACIDDEAREAAIGLTRKWRLLYVAYMWRKLTLRIISARKATKTERKHYENQ